MRCLKVFCRVDSFGFNSRTHAGCDNQPSRYLLNRTVSIHAPTRGAILASLSLPSAKSFNSRTHAGCDRSAVDTFARALVSIHAPTRGAIIVKNSLQLFTKFQFTHPRGVRLNATKKELEMSSFNSRTHAGCDCRSRIMSSFRYVSIHAPTRGAIFCR
ncbi:hypothetical protein SAMN05720468_10414 [Fibrobacter sp. UWEL]|nr:hypothetical protein SAMN05720468_10414 [Fibrobacter sp. UWEL]